MIIFYIVVGRLMEFGKCRIIENSTCKSLSTKIFRQVDTRLSMRTKVAIFWCYRGKLPIALSCIKPDRTRSSRSRMDRLAMQPDLPHDWSHLLG